MQKTKCLIYSRVSSDEQRQKGYSLDFQEKEEIQYCKNKNLEIVKHFTESHTAKIPGRPEFNKMIAYARQHKIKNLVFLKNDRASRNPVDSATLSFMAEHQGFFIHLIQDNMVLCESSRPQDFLIFEINNGFSNLYSRNLSAEVSSKMREKAEQGFYPSHAMVGYKTERIKKRSYLIVDETKAPFIREMFELYSTGNYSYSTLAAEMRERGFYISKCVKCGKSNVEDILNNPVYMGDFMWNGKRYYNAKHEPIISAELFYLCQNIIKEKTSTSKTKKLSFLFSGLIKCSSCGCQLVGELKKGKYIYYHCTGNRGGDCKRKKYLKEKHAEELFLKILNSLKVSDVGMEIIQNQIKQQIQERNMYNAEQVKEIQKKIDLVVSRLDKMFNMYLDGNLEEDFYNKKRDDFQAELDSLNTRLKLLNSSSLEIIDFSKKILELFKAAPELYLNGTFEEKRELIKLACSNFYYDGENLTITIKEAFKPIVEIASFVNGGAKAAKLELLTNNFIEKLKSPEMLGIINIIDFINSKRAA